MKINHISREHFDGTVYNLHCTPSEVYFANGVMVHNCYKRNNPVGKNMSFDTFKSIIDKMPTILQVAFGIGDIGANPDLWQMMKYCREKNIVPNITVNGRITTKDVQNLVKYCGAVSVSHYKTDLTIQAVKELSKAGLKQVNIHQMISVETLPMVEKLFNRKDEFLPYVNAVVLLSLKTKGGGVGYTPLSQEQFNQLVGKALELNIPLGMDSCSAHKYLAYLETVDMDGFEKAALTTMVEPCESGLFSAYINVDGEFSPCSFCEGNTFSIDVKKVASFDEVWYHPLTVEWRKKLLQCDRHCPLYKI